MNEQFTKNLIEAMVHAKGIVNIRNEGEEPFLLKSGRRSRFFIDVKRASLDPGILTCMADAVMGLGLIHPYCDRIASVAVGGIPLATMLSVATGIPQVIVREEKHPTGMQSQVIGDCMGLDVVLVEDVATTGGSIIKAVDAINAAGAGKCQVALVVVDREEGATEACLVEGISLYPLLRKRDFGVLEGS